MFAEHVKQRSMSETLMLVYTAKKRAEVAPGVGEKTDMVVIGPGLGSLTGVAAPVMKELEKTYCKAKIEAEKVRKNANSKISHYLQEILRETPPKIQSSSPELEAELHPNKGDAGSTGENSS
jgi:hypothetical protein